MNNLRKTIIIQRIIIVLCLVAMLIITLCCYKQEIVIAAQIKENEHLKGLAETQQSAIADLEENLRINYEKTQEELNYANI